MISQEQLQQILENQQRSFATLLQNTLTAFQPAISTGSTTSTFSTEERIISSISSRIIEFSYDPDNDIIFEKWFNRFEDILTIDANSLSDEKRTRILISKLDVRTHDRYINHILPKTPKEIKFDDTVKILKLLFGSKISLFHARFKCMKLERNPLDDLQTHMGIVNRHCENFKWKDMTEEQFKCLIFISSLTSDSDNEVRIKALSTIDSKADITLSKLCEELHTFISWKRDTKIVVEKPNKNVNVIQESNNINFVKTPGSSKRSTLQTQQPSYSCWLCGAWHYTRECSYQNHRCKTCSKVGHKEGFCPKPKPRTFQNKVKKV